MFIADDYRLAQQSSWPISYCVQQNPSLIKKHFAKLTQILKKENIHNAIKRNTFRLLQFVKIPAIYHGDIMNRSFEIIQNLQEKSAAKAFALSVLENLAEQ